MCAQAHVETWLLWCRLMDDRNSFASKFKPFFIRLKIHLYPVYRILLPKISFLHDFFFSPPSCFTMPRQSRDGNKILPTSPNCQGRTIIMIAKKDDILWVWLQCRGQYLSPELWGYHQPKRAFLWYPGVVCLSQMRNDRNIIGTAEAFLGLFLWLST